MSCGVGHRHSSDPTLLWLWRRPAAATPIGPLAWELPYAMSAALKKKKKRCESGLEPKKPDFLLAVPVSIIGALYHNII